MLFKIISDVVEVKQITEKSKEASMVLQLMDKDYTYGDALKKVLSKYKTVNKNQLEKELNKYI
jgi:DNA-directed RNA polymerase subunit L